MGASYLGGFLYKTCTGHALAEKSPVHQASSILHMTAPDFARGAESQQSGDSHLLLSEVRLPEDRQLIADVLNAIKACRQPYNLCTSWTVQPMTDGYILTAYLPRPTQQLQSVEVTHDDLHLIECINLLRVRVGVAAFAQGTWGLKIHITSHGSPVSFCMYDPVRVRAKRALVAGWCATSLTIPRPPDRRAREERARAGAPPPRGGVPSSEEEEASVPGQRRGG